MEIALTHAVTRERANCLHWKPKFRTMKFIRCEVKCTYVWKSIFQRWQYRHELSVTLQYCAWDTVVHGHACLSRQPKPRAYIGPVRRLASREWPDILRSRGSAAQTAEKRGWFGSIQYERNSWEVYIYQKRCEYIAWHYVAFELERGWSHHVQYILYFYSFTAYLIHDCRNSGCYCIHFSSLLQPRISWTFKSLSLQ